MKDCGAKNDLQPYKTLETFSSLSARMRKIQVCAIIPNRFLSLNLS